jgi:hypothetical protein
MTGIVVSPPIDVFVGSAAVTLAGVVLRGIEYAVQGGQIRDGAVRIFVREEDASAARSVVAEAASELNPADRSDVEH